MEGSSISHGHENKEYIMLFDNGVFISYHVVEKGKVIQENGCYSFCDVNGEHIRWNGTIRISNVSPNFEARPVVHHSRS